MDTVILTAITDAVTSTTGIGTAAMAIVVVFLIWRKAKQAGNKV